MEPVAAPAYSHDASMGRTAYLPIHEWLIFIDFYGFHVGKYTVRAILVFGGGAAVAGCMLLFLDGSEKIIINNQNQKASCITIVYS